MTACAFTRPTSVDSWSLPNASSRPVPVRRADAATDAPVRGSWSAGVLAFGRDLALAVCCVLTFTSLEANKAGAQRTIEFSTEAPAAAEPTTGPATLVKVGYRALVPNAALFVMMGEGMPASKGLIVEPIRYANDEALAKDLAAGAVDIGYLDAGPLVIQAETIDTVQIVATAAVDSVAFITRGDLTRFVSPGDPAAGMRRYVRFDDERIRIATLERTTVSAIAFRLWFYDRINMSQNDALLFATNYPAIWRAMLDGKLDAAFVPEPMVTDILARDPTAAVVLEGNAVLANQPTGVVAASSTFLANNRAAAVDFLELHIRATSKLIDTPSTVAKHVSQFASYGQVEAPQMLAAITSSATRFETNPEVIVDAIKAVGAYMERIGRIVRLPALVNLINPVYYREAIERVRSDPEPAGDTGADGGNANQ